MAIVFGMQRTITSAIRAILGLLMPLSLDIIELNHRLSPMHRTAQWPPWWRIQNLSIPSALQTASRRLPHTASPMKSVCRQPATSFVHILRHEGLYHMVSNACLSPDPCIGQKAMCVKPEEMVATLRTRSFSRIRVMHRRRLDAPAMQLSPRFVLFVLKIGHFH